MKRVAKVLPIVAAIIVLALLILYTGGFFRTGLIEPGREITRAQEGNLEKGIANASVERISQWYEAVGTVRSQTKANISSRVSGRILSVLVKSGTLVKKGDPLIHLDNREFGARLDQARQGQQAAQAEKERAEQALAAAQSVYSEAESNYRRVKNYFEQEAATKQELERAESAYRQAQAGVEQAKKGISAAKARVEQSRKVVEEAAVASGYTVIDAPDSGQIAERLVDPGDMAWPGKPLLVLQAPGSLRLEAHVREGVVGLLKPGARLRVTIDALNRSLEGTLEEIVPSAETASRTFLVKVIIPAVEGLYPGMFGRLYVPLGERQAVLVPKAAVRRIGQMEIVRAEEDGRWVDLFVKTGNEIDGKIEILSGLKGNEKIALATD